VFRAVTVRGDAGAILRGYREAATLARWTVTKTADTGEWSLHAQIARVDRFELRKTDLIFTSPRRTEGGFWCFPVLTDTIRLGATTIAARLGPPEY
jgi:hypothetical protein